MHFKISKKEKICKTDKRAKLEQLANAQIK